MSPKEHNITSGRSARLIEASIVSAGVTHTGHPGPCTILIFEGRSSSKRYLERVKVCPPHTSIICHGRVVDAWIRSRSERITLESRHNDASVSS